MFETNTNTNLIEETKFDMQPEVSLSHLPFMTENNRIRKKCTIPVPEVVKIELPPLNKLYEYTLSDQAYVFALNSLNLLDPYSLILEIDVENNISEQIQLDGSAHSFIEKIEIMSAGMIIERIDRYDVLHDFYSDLYIKNEDRIRRRRNEGFGINEFGTDEVRIPPKNMFLKTSRLARDLSSTDEALNDVSKSDIKNAIIDGKFPNVPIENFEYSEIDKMNQWRYVIDGKISPFPQSYETLRNQTNSKTFKIPLHLKLLGAGQEEKNYKFIPLILYNNLQILITFSKHACFVPIDLTEKEFIKGIDRGSLPLINVSSENLYTIKKVTLHTTQYKFPQGFHQNYVQGCISNGFILDYKDFILTSESLVLPQPEMTITKIDNINKLRALYVIFQTDLFKYTAYARKRVKQNMELIHIKMELAGSSLPLDFESEMNAHKSTNSHAKPTCDYFYDEIKSAIGQKNYYSSKGLISKKTFCVGYDYSHEIAKLALNMSTNFTASNYFDERWLKIYENITRFKLYHFDTVDTFNRTVKNKLYGDFTDTVTHFTPKAYYGISMERVPLIEDVMSDINISANTPLKIMFRRDLKSVQNQYYALSEKNLPKYYTYATVIYEVNRTVMMKGNGTFEYI